MTKTVAGEWSDSGLLSDLLFFPIDGVAAEKMGWKKTFEPKNPKASLLLVINKRVGFKILAGSGRIGKWIRFLGLGLRKKVNEKLLRFPKAK